MQVTERSEKAQEELSFQNYEKKKEKIEMRNRYEIDWGPKPYSFTPPSVTPAIIYFESSRYTMIMGTIATVIIM